MKKITLACFFGILLPAFLYSQKETTGDTTNAAPGLIRELSGIIITATRSENEIKNVPVRAEIISKAQIQDYPAMAADDILKNIAGANIDREFGIFSKNSSITLHGLNSAQRTLVLLDGVPMNKSDGGSINWNRIDPDEIERIEVIKGPASALYGGLAMAGVINIITKKPEKPLEGNARLFYGTFNTYGAKVSLKGDNSKGKSGFFWSFNTCYRQGDGCYYYPDSTRDTTDVRAYVKEFLVGTKAGYQFNQNMKLEFEYDFYDDKRGDGVRVYDPDGGFYKYTTHWLRTRLTGRTSGISYEVNAYMQAEDFHEQKESAKLDVVPPFAITKYTLYNTASNKDDKGMWLIINSELYTHHFLTGGLEAKSGSVDGADVYSTSTDKVSNKGRMDTYAAYLQDEARYWKDKLRITAGIRLDLANFSNAGFTMEEPTATTNILEPYQGSFPSQHWSAVSPKLGLQYEFKQGYRTYVSFGTGFRPPILDDMCRNGNISKGLKLANPSLKPEALDNYEIGADLKLFNKILLQPSVFYSKGKDFQYFVGTGDSIYSGTKPKPVLKRENIGEVEVKGLEVGLSWFATSSLELQANYAWYHSVISKFNLSGYTGQDLTGKYLMETAPNQINASVVWRFPFAHVAFYYHYIDSQWTDDENTIATKPHQLIDFKIYKELKNRVNLNLGIQNLLDNQYIDEKGQVNIGRFFMAGVGVRF